jgi:hypothetical protein
MKQNNDLQKVCDSLPCIFVNDEINYLLLYILHEWKDWQDSNLSDQDKIDSFILDSNIISDRVDLFSYATSWYDENDEYHNDKGPAIIYRDGDRQWWIHGKQIDCKTNEEFLRIIGN